MAYKINGTTVVDNSRNVCACCVTSCCITASTKLDAPSGNTASRPGSPATGSLYFDTDEGSLIAYDGSAWNAVGGAGYPALGHCTATYEVDANTTQDRQNKVPVAFNNVVAAINGSYKAGGNYASSVFVYLKGTGRPAELQEMGGGGGQAGIANRFAGATYISPDKNYYSFSAGGESLFNTNIKAFGFDTEKSYFSKSCNNTTSIVPLYMGKFGTKIVTFHNSGHFVAWCCSGTLICTGLLSFTGNTYNNIEGLFETCSGDIGVLGKCCYVIHMDLDTLAVQCAWCFCSTANESGFKFGASGNGLLQTPTAAGFGQCCRWAYLWNKETCCMYKMCICNYGSQTPFYSGPTPTVIDDKIYIRSYSCPYSHQEYFADNGCVICGVYSSGSPAYWNTENMHAFTAQNLGAKLMSFYGQHCSGVCGAFFSGGGVLNTDVTVSHYQWRSGFLCGRSQNGYTRTWGPCAAGQADRSSCWCACLNCSACVNQSLCVSCITYG